MDQNKSCLDGKSVSFYGKPPPLVWCGKSNYFKTKILAKFKAKMGNILSSIVPNRRLWHRVAYISFPCEQLGLVARAGSQDV